MSDAALQPLPRSDAAAAAAAAPSRVAVARNTITATTLYRDTLNMYAATTSTKEERHAAAERLVRAMHKAHHHHHHHHHQRQNPNVSLPDATARLEDELDRIANAMHSTFAVPAALPAAPAIHTMPTTFAESQKYLEATLQSPEARKLFGFEPTATPTTTPVMDETTTAVDEQEVDPVVAKQQLMALETEFQKEERLFLELQSKLYESQNSPLVPKDSALKIKAQLEAQGRVLARLQDEVLDLKEIVHDDDDGFDEIDVPPDLATPVATSSRQHYELMSKDKRVLLSLSLGLCFHGSDFREAPYSHLTNFVPPTRTMLLVEAERRQQALCHKQQDTATPIAAFTKMNTDSLVQWLLDHPITDDGDRFVEREVHAYLQTLPVREVDFSRNPTVLSRKIWNKDYMGAHDWVKDHTDEASVWVYSKRRRRHQHQHQHHHEDNVAAAVSGYSLRQLPIHTACSHLMLEHAGTPSRDALEHLLRRLAYEYPSGCGLADHEGKLPLHEAILHGASRDTLVVFLLQHPRALLEPDKYGRTPMDLARLRKSTTNDEIKSLLLKGVTFWEQAQQREREKQHSVVQQQQEQQHQQPLQSLVKEAQPLEAETLDTLKSRCSRLEQRLVDLYEKKSESDEVREKLLSRVSALEADRQKLHRAIEDYKNNTGVERDLQNLQQENERLQARVLDLEKSHSVDESSMSAATTHQLAPDLAAQNVALQDQVGSLTENLIQCQEKLGQLEMQVDTLRKSKRRPSTTIAATTTTTMPSTTTAATATTTALAQSVDKRSLGDFTDLLNTIGSNSSQATERYLANVVLALRQELVDTVNRANAKEAAAEDEMARLRRDNGLLKRELDKQQQIQGQQPQPKSSSLPLESIPMSSDQLDDWLAEAAAMYGSSKAITKRRPEAATPPSPTTTAVAGSVSSPEPAEHKEFFVPPLQQRPTRTEDAITTSLATASQRYSPKSSSDDKKQRLFRWKKK